MNDETSKSEIEMPKEESNSSVSPGFISLLKEMNTNMAGQKQQIGWLKFVMVTVVIVVAVGFIASLFTVYGIIQDYLINRSSASQVLVNKIEEQDKQINSLSETVQSTNLEIDRIKMYLGIR